LPRLVVIGLVVSALVSLLLIVLIPRWAVLPGAVLQDPGFATLESEASSAIWQRVGDGRIEPVPGGVRLVNDDPEAVVGLDQLIRIPAGAQAFRVTATVTLTGVVAGAERWQRPRVVIQGVTPDGRADIGGRFQLVDRAGDFGPTRLTAVFPVASPIDEARVMLRLFKATGAMEISDLVVEAAVKPPARDLLRRVLITVWLGIAAGIGLALWWQSQDRVAASLVLGGLSMLALMVVLPQSVRQPLHDLLGGVAGGDGRVEQLKPLVHLVGFAVLAMASRLAQPERPLALFVVGWLAAAIVLELAELLFSLFDRSDLVDMAFNATGAMLGLAFAGRLLWWRRGRAGGPSDPVASAQFMRRP
jgi:hypothetical protein